MKRVAIFAGAPLAALLLIALFLPSQYGATRKLGINAPVPVVFTLVDEVRRWERWSVWTSDEDPSLRYHYEGPERGVGATVHWRSDQMGDGHRVVTKVVDHRSIYFDLVLGENGTPAAGAIHFEPFEGGTMVTWSMRADLGPMLPLRFFASAFEKMIGRDLERSLVGLKKRAEDLDAEGRPVPR